VATIALYANKINQAPGLITDVKKSVVDYKSELPAIKKRSLSINKSICNLDDVISSIQTSTQTQDEKIDSLEALSKNVRDFVANTVRIDGEVAELINKRKKEFYDKYSYLTPDCEKSGWDKFRSGLKAVGEWCKEHWKLVVTAVIVVAAIVLICTGVGGIFGAMALGALLGAGIGGSAGGIVSALSGGSFWEGFENGAFSGAIAGIIAGGMGFAFSAGGKVALSLRQLLAIGGVSGAGTFLVGDLGDKLVKGVDISWDQMLANTAFSAAVGTAFAGVFAGISKGASVLKLKIGIGSAGTTRFSVEDTLSRYLLEPAHSSGGSKAKWFESALGFTKENASDLSRQIKFDLKTAVKTVTNEFGTKFEQTIPIKGANGRIIDVKFIWIRGHDGIIKLVTSFPAKK
jgi:hypothetical protein